MDRSNLTRFEYHVGWICALSVELTAARAMLDEQDIPSPDGLPADDPNRESYTYGRIGQHNIVIANLPLGVVGISSATSLANSLMRTFPNLHTRLMVGIAGGIPSRKNDIRLGDVIVSTPAEFAGGIINYQHGMKLQNDDLKLRGSLNSPPRDLLNALTRLKSQHEQNGHQISATVQNMVAKYPRLGRFQQPAASKDILFKSTYVHPDASKTCEEVCSGQDDQIVDRKSRDKDVDQLVVHYGLIASSDVVLKDASLRDDLATKYGVLCVETESAGSMECFQCVTIRGISDYADSHKNDAWQPYAAATAASYARELLLFIAPTKTVLTHSITERTDKKPLRSLTGSLEERDSPKPLKRKRTDDYISPAEIVETFRFREMEQREQEIADAELETFRWEVDGVSAERYEKIRLRFSESHGAKDPTGLMKWLANGNGIYRIIGKAGSGKSTLMKLLASTEVRERVKGAQTTTKRALFAKFFTWYSGTSMQNTLIGFMHTVIYQILQQEHSLIDRLLTTQNKVQAYRIHSSRWSSTPETWKNSEIESMWKSLMKLEGYTLCICLDGLDEFKQSPQELRDAIEEMTLLQTSWIKMVISGRDQPKFDDYVEPDTRLYLHDVNMDDIEQLVINFQKRLPKNHKVLYDSETLDQLAQRVIERAEGVIMWVKPALAILADGISEFDTIDELIMHLDTIPPNMTQLYISIIKRMPPAKIDAAAKYLNLLMEARRQEILSQRLMLPLALEYNQKDAEWILEHAKIRFSKLKLLARGSMRKVLSICSDFIHPIEDDDVEDGQFEFIHRTAYDFLISEKGQQVLRGTGEENQDWKTTVFVSQFVSSMIRIKHNAAQGMTSELCDLCSQWGNHVSNPRRVGDLVSLNTDVRTQFWLATKFYTEPSLEPVIRQPSSLDPASTPWEMVVLKSISNCTTQADKDFMSLIVLVLTGFYVLDEKAIINSFSSEQKADLLTYHLLCNCAVPVQHLGPEVAKEDLRNIIAKQSFTDLAERQLMLDTLWYRIMFQIADLSVMFNTLKPTDNILVWNNDILKWYDLASVVVEEGANVNLRCLTSEQYRAGVHQIHAATILNDFIKGMDLHRDNFVSSGVNASDIAVIRKYVVDIMAMVQHRRSEGDGQIQEPSKDLVRSIQRSKLPTADEVKVGTVINVD